MSISKDPFSGEVSSISDQGKSPETLAKTKDGSTFAAKARAAELNATRARKAVAKHAHLLIDDENDDAVENDVPPLASVPLGSFTFTSSRARASSYACKPPNNLTELPEVTAENKVKSPSPHPHSLQLLQPPSLPIQNSNQSTSCLDPPQPAAISYTEGSKASVSTEKSSIADWQTEVILKSSPNHHHRPSKHALDHTQPALQHPNQDLDPPYVHTSPSTHIDGTVASADIQSIADWPVEPAFAHIPRPSLRQASPTVNKNPGVIKASVSTGKLPVADWQTEVILKSSPHHHHKPSNHALGHSQPNLERPTQDLNPSQVPKALSTPINGTSASANRQSLANWPFEPTIAPIPRPSLPQASPTINIHPEGGEASVSTRKPSVVNWQTKVILITSPHHHRPLKHSLGHSQPSLQRPTQDLTQSQVPTPLPTHIDRTSASADRQSVAVWPFEPTIAPIHRPSLPQASPTINILQPLLSPLRAHDPDHATFKPNPTIPSNPAMRPSPYHQTQQYPGADVHNSSSYLRLLAMSQRSQLNYASNPNASGHAQSTRDPKAYTNPVHISETPRTVAHDPLARTPTTNATTTAVRSTLKPEAAIYTPRSRGDKRPEPSSSAAKTHIGSEAAGNIAMATLVKQRKRPTLEEAVQSLRKNTMDKNFAAVKKEIENRTDAMTASLVGDSFPDNDMSGTSVAVIQPKPIGYGRPSSKTITPTKASISNRRFENLDKRGGSDIMANTIANLRQHEYPAPGDHSIRYRNAHACEVDQGPDGNKSLFDPAWGTPPSRVARDPRRIRQGGSSGGVGGAFGRR